MRRTLFASLLLAALEACSGDGLCTDVAVSSGSGTTVGFGQCWDQQDRRVECTPSTPGHVACRCFVGGNQTRTFERSAPLTAGTPPSEADLAPVNEGCGWALRAR